MCNVGPCEKKNTNFKVIITKKYRLQNYNTCLAVSLNRKNRLLFQESLYSGSFAFLFLINAIVMTYSSIRWGYTTWWLATVCWIVKENSATLFFSTK
uniref:7TM_GPCR_Srx domain-containing protein n=1 Tax=Angiostrongylus cantonensis TaxID=6313 RepID=A0A0K0DIB0_ANGCA